MKNPWVIIGVLTIVLFGGAVWYSSMSNEKNNEGVEIIDHIKGNPDGEVSLIEYSDLQCPACKSFAPIVSSVMEEYGDSIRFEYRHFPLPMHPYAQQAALAAEAAGQQGKFYEYHDVLFDRQEQWSGSNSPQILFVQYAEELELDVALFRRHMNSSVLRDRVREQSNEGRERGIQSTPTFYLNGERMNPEEFQTFQGFVEQIARTVDPAAFASSTVESAESAPATSAGSNVRFGF